MAQKTLTAVPATISPKPRHGLWHDILKNRWAYVFISPFFILFTIFGLFPIMYSFYLSFQEWNGLKPIEYVGLENYTYLFGAGGKVFWQSIQNGVILFFMYVPIMTLLALVLAVILNSQRVKFYRAYRTMIFAPWVTSMIAAGFTFRILLENQGGLFNEILNGLGFPSVPWLESVWGARVSLSLLIIWGWLGYNMVLMLTGLQTIPHELNEAARIDGANSTQTFLYITIPLMRPIILFSVVLSTIGSFGLFNEVVALTNGTGGPQRSLLTPLVHIFNVAFGDFKFGRASAQAYVYFALIFVLTFFQFRYFGREQEG
jgi:lactose/L-arabinose transport system permease protein